jgi:hypothetical protein
MDFKWSVNKVTVADNNLVVKVDCTITATDADGNKAAANYARELARGDSFTPINQLTEVQVLDWCFAPQTIEVKDFAGNVIETITKLLKDEGEAQVSGQIARQLAQKAAEPALPWA